MAIVHTIDIDGEQWEIADQYAREQLATFNKNFFTEQEIEIVNTGGQKISTTWDSNSTIKRFKYLGQATIYANFQSSYFPANIFPRTTLFTIKNIYPLDNRVSLGSAQTSLGGIEWIRDGNNIVCRSQAGSNTRITSLTLSFQGLLKSNNI